MGRGLGQRLAGRAAMFYAANLASLLIPLASVPYLARVLGPAAWGELAIAQAIAATLAVLVDYGHAQSGTRTLVRAECSREAARLAGLVLWCKLLLGALGACGLALAFACGWLPVRPELAAAAVVAGIALGLSPLWLVQASDRIGRYLMVDVAAKALGLGGLLVLVHDPGDAARVLWLQAGASGVALVGGLLLARTRPSTRAPRPGELVRLLHEQRHGFLFRATILTYTTANTLVLGLVAPAHEVGIFAAADRAVRLVACFAGPLGQALYPAMARGWRDDPSLAARLAVRTTLGVAAIGLALGLALLAGAEPIARLVLGPEFVGAAPVLRVLAALPLLICVSNILGIQWMFSIGAEPALVRILALAGAVCLPTGAALGGVHGALGMAIAATLAELVVTGGILAHLAWTRSLPTTTTLGSKAHAH